MIDTVLDLLDDTYPGFDWKKRSAYMLERVDDAWASGAPPRCAKSR